jgi:hypothetical protein
MEPVITSKMWMQMHRMHPMEIACAVSVNPGNAQQNSSTAQADDHVLTGDLRLLALSACK